MGLVGAAIGSAKGRFLGGFVLGMLLGPIGWILVAVGPNYKATDPKPQPPKPTVNDNLDALAKLADLKAKGVITEAEFLAKKQELLK